MNCFLTSQDVLRELPEPVRSADFENLGSASIVDLRQEIHNTVGGDVDEAELEIRVQN